MFQALTQGAPIYILYRNEPRAVEGRITGASTHLPQYTPGQSNPMTIFQGMVTDITVQIGNETQSFNALPAQAVSANFPDKGLFICEDKAALLHEIEAMKSASEQIIKQVPMHQKMVQDCEGLLVELNPDKKRDAMREEEISTLKTKLNTMEDKFDQLIGLLSVNAIKPKKKEE